MRKIATTDELQDKLRELLSYAQSDRPSRERIAGELQALSERLTGHSKTALIDDGPVGRALNEHWNTVHDISHALKETKRDYIDAESFMGGPGQRDAVRVLEKINETVRELDNIAKRTFSDLLDEETAFIKKHGEPSEYAAGQRREMFPR
jgi:hypothetical protein